ncbi:MAG: hypothetical protein RBU29_06625 [bacterium]|jgi:hypothetical protein|nr:hypothetical protein [bacterium]
MKSAYELAMERLEKESPSGPPLTEDQRAELAAVDKKYQAKLAEIRILAEQEKKQAAGDYATLREIENRMALDLRRAEDECEERKAAIRNQTQ